MISMAICKKNIWYVYQRVNSSQEPWFSIDITHCEQRAWSNMAYFPVGKWLPRLRDGKLGHWTMILHTYNVGPPR